MFRDRVEAGQLLAQRLTHLQNQRPVVLGLPRGGVVVAAQIAQQLNAPLDVLVVRKIGAPNQPELAIGAVTDGEHPAHVLNDELVQMIGVDETYILREVQQQLQEVRARQSRYRHGRPGVSVRGRTAIVVDDGIATGATVRAGLLALRQSEPANLVLAVPVAPGDTLANLSRDVDEIVCFHTPVNFMAVGRFYENFDQTSDEQVMELLEQCAQRSSHVV